MAGSPRIVLAQTPTGTTDEPPFLLVHLWGAVVKNPRLFMAKVIGGTYIPCSAHEARELVIAYEFWDAARGEEVTFSFAAKGIDDARAFLKQCGATHWEEDVDPEALRRAGKEHLVTGRYL